MPVYKAPIDDIRFVLYELLNADKMTELPGCEDATEDLVMQILQEGSKICEDILFPLNQSGDEEGCILEDGKVTTPKGFKEAYKAFTEGGWCGLSLDPEFGGMGMPAFVNVAMQEFICSSNMSFGMYPGLSQGCYDAIHRHGNDEQKALYLPKIIEGRWSGTMCLTEPHCGTDLGLVRTKAENHPDKDGSYAVSGTKIFISAGDQDLTENIVHLVLARLPGAPEGVQGISLLVVPKFLPKEEGGDHVPGAYNDVSCGSIEHKMGIKASSTCVINFDNSKGWLVGQPNKGLKAMFTMMNAARLGVGMQGLGIAEVAQQNAVAYAKDRLQMRALDGIKEPDKPADPIIVHPDVRRMLLTGKAFCEGARALSLWVGLTLDRAEKHPDPQERQNADDLVALMTPVLKAYQTDMGSEVANLAVQVHGGHGYIREYGVEQYVRDARIAQIYEGTNGIQALDLVGRKMPQNMGRLLRSFFHPVSNFIEENQADPAMGEFVFPLAKAFMKLQQTTAIIAQKGMKDPLEAGAAATDYLRQFALVAQAFIWARMAKVALEKLSDENESNKEFYENKIKTAQFFIARMLPEADAKFKMILAGGDTLMAMKAEAF
tara:strand:- start:126610 stop:128418 length:1809 start_codon:yes stop_codon:yes gene_type:complete